MMDRYVQQLPDYTNAVDDAGRKDVKHKELEKFMSVLFLSNARHKRFGDLLVQYRKSFAANGFKYPDNLSTSMDVTRQQPIKKKRKLLQKKSRERKGERGRSRRIKFCHDKSK